MNSLKTLGLKWAKATLSKCALNFFVLSFCAVAIGAVTPANNASSLRSAAKPPPERSLSLVTFFDSVEGQVFNWWAENTVPGPMAKAAYALNRVLPANVYVHPNQEKVVIPEELKKTDLNTVEKLRLAKLYNAAVIVSGDVRFSKSPVLSSGTRIKVQLKAQPVRGPATELVRILDLTPRELSGLSGYDHNPVAQALMELQDQLKKFSPQPQDDHFELIVSGKINHEEWENFKRTLRREFKGIKNIQEVAFENEQVALKIFYAGSGGAESMSYALSKMHWNGFRTQVVSHDEEQVFFNMKAKEKN